MCGRFTTTIDLEEIERYFNIKKIEGDYTPLYNAAPMQKIPVIIGNNPRTLVLYRWGLVPSWAKDTAIDSKLINARAETLKEKPSFRQSFMKKRCLIPADSFFEWKKEGKRKQPYRIMLKNLLPFAIAGLWDSWHLPNQQPLYTCVIITTQANALVHQVHDRMPVILNQNDYSLWLDPSIQDANLLQQLLAPYPEEFMDMYPVSSLVNSPLINKPEVIRPV